MKVIALLSWFSESVSWLAATTASVARFCDHIVAVDGAYALYPEARARSGAEQAQVIMETADGAGIGSTIHRPQHVWADNEVEKRTFLFAAGALVAKSYRDWFLVLDADDVITDVPFDLRERLEATEQHVAGVTLWWRDDPNMAENYAKINRRHELPRVCEQRYHRGLFRALPGLRVEGAHMVNVGEDNGRTVYLRGLDGHHELEPMADFTDLRIEHRTLLRDLTRAKQQQHYYSQRDQSGAENLAELLTA